MFIGDCEVQTGDVKAKLYGPAEFVPGYRFAALLSAHSRGELRGAIGISFPRVAVASFVAEVRAKVGAILKLIPPDKFYVWDELSVQWALHYSVQAKLGGDPRWLLNPGLYDYEAPRIARTVQEAFQLALTHKRFVLQPEMQGLLSEGHHKSEHILTRWAQRWIGSADCVIDPGATTYDTQREVVVSAEALARHKQEARDTLADILREPQRKGNLVKLAKQMGEEVPPPADEKARIFSGVMDPATHYDDHYYGVDGKYILYPRPDGTWESYRGTAHTWEGNKVVARIIDRMFKKDAVTKLLDVGCGAGDFVQRMLDLDWDAIGTDISSAARERSTCPDKIIVGDIVQFAREETLDSVYDVVTAFDFWEHVYEKDIDDLAVAIRKALKPGGIHVACICTHGVGERDWVFPPGEKITPENAWCLVSGHVTVRVWGWWLKQFKALGLEPHYAAMTGFNVQRDQDPALRNCASWSARNIVICKRRG